MDLSKLSPQLQRTLYRKIHSECRVESEFGKNLFALPEGPAKAELQGWANAAAETAKQAKQKLEELNKLAK